MKNLAQNGIDKMVNNIVSERKIYQIDHPSKEFRELFEKKIKTKGINIEKIASLEELKKLLKKFKKNIPTSLTLVIVEKTNEIIGQARNGFVFSCLNGEHIRILYFIEGKFKNTSHYNQWFTYCTDNHIVPFNWKDILPPQPPPIPEPRPPEPRLKIFKKIVLYMVNCLQALAVIVLIYLPLKTVFSRDIPELTPSIFAGEALSIIDVIFIFIVLFVISMIVFCHIKKVSYDYYYRKFYRWVEKDSER